MGPGNPLQLADGPRTPPLRWRFAADNPKVRRWTLLHIPLHDNNMESSETGPGCPCGWKRDLHLLKMAMICNKLGRWARDTHVSGDGVQDTAVEPCVEMGPGDPRYSEMSLDTPNCSETWPGCSCCSEMGPGYSCGLDMGRGCPCC
jgi:hypothetical protein